MYVGVRDEMEPLVSIIVPVYNAEKYLERCVGSVLAQEYKNFELFLVDDGSTDGSAAICDGYSAGDARVRVIHKENTGVSDSRNQALNQAEGKYLQFLDADDWLTPDATKLFVQSAESSGCDMVIADFYRVAGEKLSHKGDIEKEGLLTREEFANFMMENPADFYYGVLWNKFYRRELVEERGLRMDPDISWCEDFIFNMEYIRHCKTIYALQVPVYYYVKTKGSLVNSQGASINNTIRMKLNVFEYYHQFYKELYDEESYDTIRFQVHKFFVTYAKDGFVPPVLLSGSMKLGRERQSVCMPEAVEGEGIFLEAYRYRKLWERYLEVVALKNDITLEEVLVLLCLHQNLTFTDTEQLADLSGLSRRSVGSALQKLEKRGMVKRETVKAGKTQKADKTQKTEKMQKADKTEKPEKASRRRRFAVLPAAAPVFQDLEQAEKDFASVRFRDFSDGEKARYGQSMEKINENVKSVLRS